MTEQEKDRIECAIRHIQTAADVDPWAREIAVDALRKQIPKKPDEERCFPYCPCGRSVLFGKYKFCPNCGQKITWEGG